MSQQNVEIVRRGYESMKRRDFGAVFERVAPDFEVDLSSLYPDAPVLRGVDELMRWVYSGPWGGSVRLDPERFFDVDAERVLVFVRVTATGEGSGVPVELRDAHELTIREGLLVRCKVHLDQGAALEAVGLSQQSLIRAGYKSWSDGDLDAFLETLDPEIELLTSGSFPDFPAAYRGYDGMRSFWESIRAPWEWLQLDVERIVEGDDCAAVAVHFRVRGAGSGAVTDLKQGHALWFRHGRTVKVSTHASFDQALEAAGLSEQDAHADS